MVTVKEIRDEEEFDGQFDNEIDNEYTTDEEGFDENDGVEGNRRGYCAYIPLFILRNCRNWIGKLYASSMSFAKFVGKSAWIITTSMLLIGLPLLYAYDREKSLVEYEKEQQRFAPPVASQ